MDNYTNKKELSEEDIKNRYITPALNSAGWNNDEFRMELKVKTQFTDGKISLSGNRAHREKPKFADYVLYTETNYPIAVVEGRVGYLTRLCMVVDWCIDHPEYTAKIKVMPKKDYPILMPCEF